jgi:hypothetical protein
MTIERRSPLPVETYWQDLLGDRRTIWFAAVKGLNADGLVIQVLTTEDYPNEAKPRIWVRYKVLKPVPWDHVLLGSPNIATDDVQTSDDTVTKPDVPDPLDSLTSAAASMGTPAKVLVWSLVGLVGVAGVALIWRIARPRTRTRESVTGHVRERIR